MGISQKRSTMREKFKLHRKTFEIPIHILYMGYFKFFEHLLKPTYYGSYFVKFYELKKTLYRVWMTILDGYDVTLRIGGHLKFEKLKKRLETCKSFFIHSVFSVIVFSFQIQTNTKYSH